MKIPAFFSRTAAASLLLYPASLFGGVLFSATADNTNTTGDGLGVAIEGELSYTENGGNPFIDLLLTNLSGTGGRPSGTIVAFGFFLPENVGFQDIDPLPSNPVPVGLDQDTNLGFNTLAGGYSFPGNGKTPIGNLEFGHADFGAKIPNGPKGPGLQSGKSALFRINLTLSGGASASDFNSLSFFDPAIREGDFSMIFRFQEVSSPGGSTKFGLNYTPPPPVIPEPSTWIAGLSVLALGASLYLRRRR